LPVYEYRCHAGHFYEKQEGFDAPNQHKCQECGKTAKRQISLPAVIFKGSGFYSTDNRSGNHGNGASSSSETSEPVATTSSDDHGHSQGPGGPSPDTKPKVEATVD